MSSPLTRETLVLPRENRYYICACILSLILWALIAITIFGLLYALCLALFLWCVNGLFVAYLRAEAIEVNEEQLPALFRALRESCAQLGFSKTPRLYLMQADGMFNAFATRHARRDFVVVFSSLLEALGEDTPEMRFVLGHEVGHIMRKHILKTLFILPARIVPLLGSAYSRACEATCDRFGALACGDVSASARALCVLAGGKEGGRNIAPERFAAQYFKEDGVFVSWHELTSDYPTLSQRVHNMLSLSSSTYPSTRSRSPLAYLLALLFSKSSIYILCVAYIAIIAIASVRALGQKASTSGNLGAGSQYSQQESEDMQDEE